MDLHTLKPAKGAVKKGKRVGRGQGSGKGGTATRGHKGAQSRSGYTHRFAFEGGQNPLQRRIPKRGFKNINRVEYAPINLDTIQYLIDNHKIKKLDLATLVKHGVVSKNDKVKVLGRGELTTKIDVEAHKISETAKQKIEGLGGAITLL